MAARCLPFDASGSFGELAARLEIQQSAWPEESTMTTESELNPNASHHQAILPKTTVHPRIGVNLEINPTTSHQAL